MNARGLVRIVYAVTVLLCVGFVSTAAGGSAPLPSSGAQSYHPVVAFAPEVPRVSCACLLCDAEGWYNPFAGRSEAPAATAPVVGHLHTYFPPEQNRVPEVKEPNYGYPANNPLNGWSPWGGR